LDRISPRARDIEKRRLGHFSVKVPRHVEKAAPRRAPLEK
jgi:hypothetical protein